jgi:hypothetical protein
MLSTITITLRGGFGGRLLGGTGNLLRGFMGLYRNQHMLGLGRRYCLPAAKPTSPTHPSGQFGLVQLFESVKLSVAASGSEQSGSEQRDGISQNILEWLNSDRNNWSGESRIKPDLI